MAKERKAQTSAKAPEAWPLLEDPQAQRDPKALVSARQEEALGCREDEHGIKGAQP